MRRCPAIESSEYLCGRLAEYEVSGSVYCAIHARRVTEAAIDEHALPADLGGRSARG